MGVNQSTEEIAGHLVSTNVESTEELQRLNRELQTANDSLLNVVDELAKRNLKLIEQNTDYENLTNSSGAIYLFLNNNLQLRSYTQSISPIFKFSIGDIGKNLKEFALPYPGLINDIKQVVSLKETIKKEFKVQFQGKDTWYLQSIHPYRTAKDEFEGVVLNYQDVTTIKSTNQLLTSILKTSPGVIYVFNLKERKNEYTSPFSVGMLGYSPKELQEMGIEMMHKLIHPEDVLKLTNHFENIRNSASDEVQICEYRVLRKGTKIEDNNPSYLRSYDLPMERDGKNKVIKMCGIAHEVTDLKITQVELEEQNKLLSNITKISPYHIAITDVKTRKVSYTSNTLLKSLGYESLQHEGDVTIGIMEKVMPNEEFIKFSNFLDDIVKTNVQQSYQMETHLLDMDDKVRWYKWSSMPYEWTDSGSMNSIIHFVEEITDLKSTQFEVEEQNKLLSNITNISPFHTIISAANTHQVIYSTGTFLRSMGYGSMDEFPGLDPVGIMKKIMPAQDFMGLIGMLKKCVERNTLETYQFESKAYDINGVVRWFQWRIKPYEWTVDGNIKSIIHFMHEITELKENQLKLEMINSELEEFSYVSSHDLQQPLNTIQSSLKILMNELKDYNGNPSVAKCLDMMADTSASMKQNIKSILDYSKVKSDISFHKVSLNKVMTTVLTSLSSIIQEVGATISNNQNLPIIKGDTQLIGLVFQNLITNAIKFQRPDSKPEITIKYEQTSTHEILHFTDNGIGISEKQQSRIFTLFQRLHKDEEYEGSGIGLAHANKIMRLHSGKIQVVSTPGEGSTFSCFFLRGT